MFGTGEAVEDHDDAGQVTGVIDANGNRTTYAYDGHDRLSRTYMPSPDTPGTSAADDYEELGYDAAGNVASRRLRSGETIAYSYDALNRLERKDLPGTAADTWYGYDLQGRLTAAAFTASWTGVTFGYDGFGRMAWTQNT